MAFLSSKLVREVQNIFELALGAQSVRAGQMELANLREKPYFELALANFLSRSNNHNHRIFAALQLQKKVVLKDIQTVAIIKETYFRDIDKIACIMRKIVTNDENFGWAGQFLSFNFDQMGVMESVRYILLVFSWLSDSNRAVRLIKEHFHLIIKSFEILAQIVAESADSLFMLMVTLSMFIHTALQVNPQSYFSSIKNLWSIFDQKCKFYGAPKIDLLKAALQKFLFDQRSSHYPQNCFSDLLISLLNNQWTQNQLKLSFQSRCLHFVLIHEDISRDWRGISEFISAMNVAAYRSNHNVLIQSSYKTLTEINNKQQEELLGKQEQTVRKIICDLIEYIFQHQYQLISENYKNHQKNENALFIILLPLLNYYNSTRSQAITAWVTDHIESASNHIGHLLSLLKLQSFVNKELRNQFVGCLELLVKYKMLVPLKMLPHIVFLLQEISAQDCQMSSLCYLFVDQVWEELAFLDFSQLADFILKHLRLLNGNEWDHCFEYYSCFLNLVQHLEQRYQFYTHLITTDDLVLQSIRSHQIMVGLLMQTPPEKLNFELVNKIFIFTSYLLGGILQDKYASFHQGLRINYLTQLIHKHHLYRIENARVLAFDHVVTGKTISLRVEEDAYWGTNADQNNSEFQNQVTRESVAAWLSLTPLSTTEAKL